MAHLLRTTTITAALIAQLFVMSSSAAIRASGPFHGAPVPLPGTVEAGDFDDGPSGESYWDSTPGNSGGAYRAGDVDIETSADGGYDIGWAEAHEWLNYTVDVQTAGSYLVQFRVTSPNDNTSIHFGFNGPSQGTWVQMPVPKTGGWQSWTTISTTVTLGAGVQQLTVLFDTGWMNLGRMTVTT